MLGIGVGVGVGVLKDGLMLTVGGIGVFSALGCPERKAAARCRNRLIAREGSLELRTASLALLKNSEGRKLLSLEMERGIGFLSSSILDLGGGFSSESLWIAESPLLSRERRNGDIVLS